MDHLYNVSPRSLSLYLNISNKLACFRNKNAQEEEEEEIEKPKQRFQKYQTNKSTTNNKQQQQEKSKKSSLASKMRVSSSPLLAIAVCLAALCQIAYAHIDPSSAHQSKSHEKKQSQEKKIDIRKTKSDERSVKYLSHEMHSLMREMDPRVPDTNFAFKSREKVKGTIHNSSGWEKIKKIMLSAGVEHIRKYKSTGYSGQYHKRVIVPHHSLEQGWKFPHTHRRVCRHSCSHEHKRKPIRRHKKHHSHSM